jgi:hypothetical protein
VSDVIGCGHLLRLISRNLAISELLYRKGFCVKAWLQRLLKKPKEVTLGVFLPKSSAIGHAALYYVGHVRHCLYHERWEIETAFDGLKIP